MARDKLDLRSVTVKRVTGVYGMAVAHLICEGLRARGIQASLEEPMTPFDHERLNEMLRRGDKMDLEVVHLHVVEMKFADGRPPEVQAEEGEALS